MEEKKWFVVYSKPRCEKKIDDALIRQGITSYCPVRIIEKQWTDRKKIIEEPIFRSYVFVHINELEKNVVLQTLHVLNFVYYLGKPAIIRDEEIDLIKRFLMDSDVTVNLISSVGFKKDTKVRVSHGIFQDKQGTVIRDGKKKVYVQIESLGQVMVVEFKTDHLTPIKSIII